MYKMEQKIKQAFTWLREQAGRIELGFKGSGHELTPEEKTLQEIWTAHQHWQNAVDNFNFADEEDLVDLSIYNIETCQKQYTYLLKKAKEQNLTVPSLLRMYMATPDGRGKTKESNSI